MRIQFSLVSLLMAMIAVSIAMYLSSSPPPPTVSDWQQKAPPSGTPVTDECYAFEHFYGKTRPEAFHMLQESDMYYIEDFRYMPKQVFAFYFPVLIHYVSTEPFDEKSDAANMLFGVVESAVKNDIESIKPHWSRVRAAMEHVANNQKGYGAPEKVYGRFSERVARIVANFENSQSGGSSQ